MNLPRCPNCRARPIRYTEMWTDHSMCFEAIGLTGQPEEVGYMSEGRPHYVLAECGCGKIWRLRGVLQITDLHDATKRALASGEPRAAPFEKPAAPQVLGKEGE